MDTSDSEQVQPGEGTYSQQHNPCGCRSVPEGQHLPGCRYYGEINRAPECPNCGYRTKTTNGRCGVCGAEMPDG